MNMILLTHENTKNNYHCVLKSMKDGSLNQSPSEAEIHEASTKFMSVIHDLTRPIPEDETEEQKSRRMARARLLSIEFLR